MTTRDCRRCGRKTTSGNCPATLDDGHVVQCVGEWADNVKHEYLRRYIDATRQVRRGYAGRGFVDLFAGPGRVRLRDTNEVRDGSPLIALAHEFAPFTKVVLCDLAAENIAALEHRTAAHRERVEIVHGDANVEIARLIAQLPTQGLNLAFIDPFGLRPLHFSTIRALANLERMDLLVNFPTSDIRRNQALYFSDSSNEFITRMLGNERWRDAIGPRDLGVQIMELFVQKLEDLGYTGYTGARTRNIRVSNPTGAELYRIVFASKHRRGREIWNDITKHTARGQRSFGFE